MLTIFKESLILALSTLIVCAILYPLALRKAYQEYKRYSGFLFVTFFGITSGLYILDVGCEPRARNFGQCFPVPPWVGYLCFACAIYAFIHGIYLIWKDKKDQRMHITQFAWGETVRVKAMAPKRLRPGELAEVCGMWTVKSEANAIARGEAVGTTIYTIEFGDGTSVEIAEQYLEGSQSGYE